MTVPAPNLSRTGTVTVLEFAAPGVIADARASELSEESQAALRQFSPERITGYGVDDADATQLRERVLRGEAWLDAASGLAVECETRAVDTDRLSARTRSDLLRRASALHRISQVMMLADTDRRRAIYARAAADYSAAAELSGDRSRISFESPTGTVVGWLFPATGDPRGSAIVLGGIEGWAMDFDSIGSALADRGVTALLLDAPGQGETRFLHHHYLGAQWRSALVASVDELLRRVPDLPVGIIGNSMGGSIALAAAGTDSRLVACVNNGGIAAPWLVPPSSGTFFTKMVAFCGQKDAEPALAIWQTVTPLAESTNAGGALLCLHGGADALVSKEMADALFDRAPVAHKEMVIFSDGIHCIYNHQSDRDAVMADWMSLRLRAVSEKE